LADPEVVERTIRRFLPEVQEHLTSDDYTEYTWHCPTVRMIVARPVLSAPPGFNYPAWVHNALGGIPATIDPTIQAAAKAIGATLIELLTNAGLLAAARAEFVERTGGGSAAIAGRPIAPGRFQGTSSIAMARVRDHRARRGMVHSVAGR